LIAFVPPDQLLIESDADSLEDAEISINGVVGSVAEVRGWTNDELIKVTNQNGCEFCGIPESYSSDSNDVNSI
jgi:Tat protein secretion system quality control protein TatD with DNase activity